MLTVIIFVERVMSKVGGVVIFTERIRDIHDQRKRVDLVLDGWESASIAMRTDTYVFKWESESKACR